MITMNAVLSDGRNALDDLEGASPSGGHVTSRAKPRIQIRPGDVVRHYGAWMIVADIRHDGLLGITQAALIDVGGHLHPHSMTGSEGMTARTDTRIDPDTLYMIRRACHGHPGQPGDDVYVVFTWQETWTYQSALNLSRAAIAADGHDPCDPDGVLAYLRAEAASGSWTAGLDKEQDRIEVTGRTVDRVTAFRAAGGTPAACTRCRTLIRQIRGTWLAPDDDPRCPGGGEPHTPPAITAQAGKETEPDGPARFVLDEARARQWLARAVIQFRDGTSPGEKGYDETLPELGAAWAPSDACGDTTIQQLIDRAQDAGIIRQPRGAEIGYEYLVNEDGGSYRWRVFVDVPGGGCLRLAGISSRAWKIGGGDAGTGAGAALAVLSEAEAASNEVLGELADHARVGRI